MEEYLEVYTNSLDGTETPIKSFIKRSNIISFLIQKDEYSYSRYYLYVYCTDGHNFIIRKSKRTICFKSENEAKVFLADLENNDKEESSFIHY